MLSGIFIDGIPVFLNFLDLSFHYWKPLNNVMLHVYKKKTSQYYIEKALEAALVKRRECSKSNYILLTLFYLGVSGAAGIFYWTCLYYCGIFSRHINYRCYSVVR